MKVSQSFVVASLSVAAQTQVNRASPLPDPKETELLSPRLNESQLAEVLPTRLIPRGFGRRALPSQLLQASANLDSRHRAVSLNVGSNGRVSRPPPPPSQLQSLRNHRQQVTGSDENLLQASLGSHSRPDAQADRVHLLDLSLKLRRRYPDDNNNPAASIPGTIQQVSGHVSGSVSNVVSSLPPTVVGTLSNTLDSNPLGIPSALVTSPVQGLLSSTSMVTEHSQSLPASLGPILSSLPIVNQLSPSGLPILGQILTTRSDPIDPSSGTYLDHLSSATPIPVRPPNPFHQGSITASNLLAAGGAFPIQPSHSLDGQAVANEPSIPNFSQLLKDAQAIKTSGSSSSVIDTVPKLSIDIDSSDGKQDQDDPPLPSYLRSHDPPSSFPPINPPSSSPISRLAFNVLRHDDQGSGGTTDQRAGDHPQVSNLKISERLKSEESSGSKVDDQIDGLDVSANTIGSIPGSLTSSNGSIPVTNSGESSRRILVGSTSTALNGDGVMNEIEELDLLSTLKGLTDDSKMNLELDPILNKIQQNDLPLDRPPSLDQSSGSISNLQQLRKKLNLIPSSLSLSRLNLPNFKASTPPAGTDPDPNPSTTNPSSFSSSDPSSSSPDDQNQKGDDNDGHQPPSSSSSPPTTDPDQDPTGPKVTPLEEKANDEPTTIDDPQTSPPSTSTSNPDQKTDSNSNPTSSSSTSKLKRWLRKRSSNLSFRSSRHQS